MYFTIEDDFTRIHLQGARSARGFLVESAGRRQLRYREGDREALVEVEDGLANLVIYTSTLGGWEPPHAAEPMSSEKRDEIIRRVSEALTFLGTPHVLE